MEFSVTGEFGTKFSTAREFSVTKAKGASPEIEGPIVKLGYPEEEVVSGPEKIGPQAFGDFGQRKLGS